MKLPVVLAEKDDVQVLIGGRDVLEPSVRKVTDITADIRDLRLDIVVLDLPDTWQGPEESRVRVKVIIFGVLHKQIFWVGRDNRIHHKQINEPFATFALFTEQDIAEYGERFNKQSIPIGFPFDERRIQAQVWQEDVEAIVTHLVSPSQLQESVVIGFTIKLEQLTQLPIKSQ